MKTFFKVLAALAAVAGVVYVIATYGDKIVAWARKLLSTVCWEDCCCDDDCCCGDDDCCCNDEDCCCGESVHAEEADFEG